MYYIDLGRKGLATEGGESEGRILFAAGLLDALAVFKEVSDLRSAAKADCNLEILILVEHAYLTEELRYCSPKEPMAIASVTQAIAFFDDALRSLEAVQDTAAYQVAEKTHPRHPKYRIQGMPKDAFHIACISHRTRLHNILRAPGINATEIALYKQRTANMTAAQNAYLEKQQSALTV
jgi:hypothetical protein